MVQGPVDRVEEPCAWQPVLRHPNYFNKHIYFFKKILYLHLEIWYYMSINNNNKNQGHNTLHKDIKYLDPKADVTFKLVFGEHEDLVMSLLNALLPLDEDGQITHVEYLSPEMVPENPGK